VRVGKVAGSENERVLFWRILFYILIVAYFNYSTVWPTDWWARRSFVGAWWKLYADDPYWSPPDYAAWHRLVVRMDAPYWQRIDAQPVYMEALPQRRQSAQAPAAQPLLAGAVFEEAVAAAVLLCAPQSQGAAYLGMLRCTNDEESLDRLLAAAMERAAESGCTRLIGPAGLVPAWGGGALTNHFDQTPPIHTPYNPPYLADLLATSMSVCQESVVLSLPVISPLPQSQGPAVLTSLQLDELVGAHWPLLQAALAPHAPTPSIERDEASLLLQWIATAPTLGWLAQVEGAPVGFVVVQPDLAPLLRRTGGGRLLPLRWFAAWARRRPVRRGRLLFGAVAPAWRRQGIGSQLLAQALHHAAGAGWTELACGPYAVATPAVSFLQRVGAYAKQRYALFEWNGY